MKRPRTSRETARRISSFNAPRHSRFEVLEPRLCLASYYIKDVKDPQVAYVIADTVRPASGTNPEGYLVVNSSTALGRTVGVERTGFVTTRHPSFMGKDNSDIGYDVSSARIDIDLRIVLDRFAEEGNSIYVEDELGKLKRTQDEWRLMAEFDVANQTYQELGISVVLDDNLLDLLNKSSVKPTDLYLPEPSVRFPIDFSGSWKERLVLHQGNVLFTDSPSTATQQIMTVLQRGSPEADKHAVPVSLVTSIVAGGGKLQARVATSCENAWIRFKKADGIVIATEGDGTDFVVNVDTLAHELGHILEHSRFSEKCFRHVDASGMDDETHSLYETNVVSSYNANKAGRDVAGPYHVAGGRNTNGSIGFTTKDGTQGIGFQSAGPDNGMRVNARGPEFRRGGWGDGIGGIVRVERSEELYEDRSDLDPSQGTFGYDPGIDPKVSQPQAMLKSSAVQWTGARASFSDYGAKADFYWVSDNGALDDFIGADEETRESISSDDWIEWIPSEAADIATVDFEAERSDWLLNQSNLPTDAYVETTFDYVDVVSLTARYGDQDVSRGGGKWSRQDAALDYVLEFKTASGWERGFLTKVYKRGWTEASSAEDYVARWVAGRAGGATAVRIRGHSENGGDGNTQIDAIIAGQTNAIATTTGFQYQRGGSLSFSADKYVVDFEIESPDHDVGHFSVALYGYLPGSDEPVLIGEPASLNWPFSAAEPVPGQVEFGVDQEELRQFVSIFAVVDAGNEITEVDESDNVAKIEIVDTGLAVEVGVLSGTLTNPAGFVSDGTFFHAINGGGIGAPSLFRINATTLATSTLTFSGAGVSGARDWQDLAIGSGGSFLYVADIGSSTSSMRILKTPTPNASTSCTSNLIVLNTDATLLECEYDVTTLSYPSGSYDAKTLLVDEADGSFNIVTTDGRVYKRIGSGAMTFVVDLPFSNVLGGDSPPTLIGGEAILLKTDEIIYKFPFRGSGHTLADMLQYYSYWQIPYDSDQKAQDVALSPSGNGFYMILDGSPGPASSFPIWHSQPSAPLSNIRFGTDEAGEDWTLSYEIPDDTSPFTISVYRSADGISVYPGNKIGEFPVTGDDLTEGPHTIEINPTFSDFTDDYKLVAVIGDMRIPFSGGAFRSSSNTVHVVGTDESDVIGVEADGTNIIVTVNGAIFEYVADGVPAIQVRGQDGNDEITLAVPSKVSRVLGGADSDFIDGSEGQGTLDGGDGDDVLIGGSAITLLCGLAGDDTYVFTTVDATTVAVLDNAGNDTVDFSQVTFPISIDLSHVSSAQVVVEIEDSPDYELDFDGSVIENVIGSEDADTITGNAAANLLSGGLGADTYRFANVTGSTLGSDTIDDFAEVDGDTIDFTGLTSTMLGSGGITLDLSSYEVQNVAGTNGSILKLTLTNPLGVDNVIGTAGPDSITGNDGANVLTGAGGNDTLTGGAGDDIYRFVGSSLGTDSIYEADAVDVDTLDFSGLTTTPGGTTGLTGSLRTGSVGVSGFITLNIAGVSGIENVIGTTANDTIVGNGRPNRIEGGLGNDTLNGDRGDDVYVFARGAGQNLGDDVIEEFGNSDHDTLDYSGTVDAKLSINLSATGLQNVLYEGIAVKGKLDLRSIGAGGGTTIEGVIGTADNDTIVGNYRPNRFEGRGGNDTMYGHDGVDTLGGGDDTYVFARIENENLGQDVIREGLLAGYDVLDFSGMNEAVNVDLAITGSSYAVNESFLRINLITGDSMAGGDSIEHVIGSDHDDVIRGNTLANHLRGGLGDDTIEGRDGNDILDGGEGSDWYKFDDEAMPSMVGTLGDDLLREGEAADSDTLDFSEFSQGLTVNLTSGVTVASILTLSLNRADGVENVIGTAYADVLLGNDRPNRLEGRAGDDGTISGGAGDDTLIGGEGNDNLTGGAGDDTYAFPRGTGQNLHTDTLNESTGGGTDTLDFSEFLVTTGTVTVNLNATSTSVFSGGLSLTLSSTSTLENVIGSPNNDAITGNSAANVLEGGEGNDTLAGNGGDDVYRFARLDDENLGVDSIGDSGGNDTIDLSEIDVALVVTASAGAVTGKFNYTVTSGAIEKLIGGALDDELSGNGVWLVGGPGYDTLTGNSGADTLEGGEGDDDLIGAAGNDVYRFRRLFFEDLGVDRVFEEVGQGTDLLDFADFDESLFVDLATKTQQRVADRALELILLQDDNTTRSDIENVIGSAFDDVLLGNELTNTLVGGDGDDVLEGRAENDSLEGGFGGDTYLFEQVSTEDLGDDSINEVAHRDADLLDFSSFKSGVSVDLSASGMNNVDPTNSDLSLNFVGGDYSIEGLIGTDGNDSLTGNNRPNWLEGGKGNDTLSGDLGDDRYVFRVFGDDDLGTDVIQDEVLYGGRDVLDFGEFIPSDGVGINGTSGLNLGTLSGSVAQDIHSQLSLRLHTTAAYLDSVVGSPFADKLIGNSYANILFGGEGNDTLEGGSANDTLVGDGGDDSLVGGNENDTYLFDRTETDDLGHDTITETASAQIETLDFSLFGEGVVVDLSIGSTPQIVHVDYLTITLSSASAFDNVVGTPFDDTLQGNVSNNNVLNGGAGDDTYVFFRASNSVNLGSDTILDYAGDDTLDFSGFGTDGVFTALYNAPPTTTNQFQVNRVGSAELTLQVPVNQLENVIGSAGNDDINGIGGGVLMGGAGDDTLDVVGDDATLIGGEGNDYLDADNYRATLEGGRGDDTLNGEAGDTTYVFVRDDTVTDLGDDVIVGEGANVGLDVLDFSAYEGGVTVDLVSLTAIDYGSGAFSVVFDASTIENVIGSADVDWIIGDARPNRLQGGGGSDSIVGGSGDDTLIGEDGNDTLIGNDGADQLEGGMGNDSLTGNGGNDSYLFTQYEGEDLGQDTVTEGASDGTNDALDFSGFGAGATVDLSTSSTPQAVSTGNLQLVLTNASTIERIEGSEFDDYVTAGSGTTALYGHFGDDTLLGGSAAGVTLYGGAGDDVITAATNSTKLYGGPGNDQLTGGAGTDSLYGEAGDDVLSGTGDATYGGLGHDYVDLYWDSDPSVGGMLDPTSATLVLDPDDEVERGGQLTLSLATIADLDGIVLNALFYWDADDDGVLNLQFDTLVGSQEINGTSESAEVQISLAGFPLGDARFFARVTDNQGLFSEVYSDVVEIVDAPPRVQKVLVSSTEWTPEFYTSLGDPVGYSIPYGYGQLRPLPWMNVNRVHIRFTEDVSIEQDDLRLRGVNITDYEIASFSYDAATFTATWTFTSFFGTDKFLIYLEDSVTDLNGNALDGEWVDYPTSGYSSFPSGNGTAGGVFQFRFNALLGDVSSVFAPYVTNSIDSSLISVRRGMPVGGTLYASRADLDGNGIIDEVDYLFVQIYISSSPYLPGSDPTPP